MVVQGINDGSKIRECMVTEKQGCGDECDTREGNQGKVWRWVSMGVGGGSREDP